MIDDLNKNFESRVRLGIMSLLVINDWVDFLTMKETLQLTDGNLASHLKALEKLAYVEMSKDFIGRKPRTQYKATKLGSAAFKQHIMALEKLINDL